MKLLEVAEFLKNQAIKRFQNKIAIIVLYGSIARGKDDQFSDIDMFAIVDNQEDTDLPWEFVLQEHTVDFWKMDWQQAEQMAMGVRESNPWAVSASLFLTGKTLYTRSDSDKVRFNLVVEKTKHRQEENFGQILKNFNSRYSTVEIINLAKRNNDLLSARWAIWQLINNTVKDLSLLNNISLTKNWGANLSEVFNLPILPENYSKLVITLSSSNNFDEMVSLGSELISSMRELMIKKQQNIFSDQNDEENPLCDNYVSMKAYINKILSACQKRDILAASYAATELQIWIAELVAKAEGKLILDVDGFNLFEEIKLYYNQLNLPDLMDGISNHNFQEIEKTVIRLDLILKEYCQAKKFKLPILKDLAEFEVYFPINS